MFAGDAEQPTEPDPTPCSRRRSSYLRDYTCSEDRPQSAGVRPRLLSKVASANHASQREGDSDVETEPWVLEGWKDEASSVLDNACQTAKLPSKYTRNTPCPLPTNVRRVASAAVNRPKPTPPKPTYGQRPRGAALQNGGDGGTPSKQASTRPKVAPTSRSSRPPIHNLEVGDESDEDSAQTGRRVASTQPLPLAGIKEAETEDEHVGAHMQAGRGAGARDVADVGVAHAEQAGAGADAPAPGRHAPGVDACGYGYGAAHLEPLPKPFAPEASRAGAQQGTPVAAGLQGAQGSACSEALLHPPPMVLGLSEADAQQHQHYLAHYPPPPQPQQHPHRPPLSAPPLPFSGSAAAAMALAQQHPRWHSSSLKPPEPSHSSLLDHLHASRPYTLPTRPSLSPTPSLRSSSSEHGSSKASSVFHQPLQPLHMHHHLQHPDPLLASGGVYAPAASPGGGGGSAASSLPTTGLQRKPFPPPKPPHLQPTPPVPMLKADILIQQMRLKQLEEVHQLAVAHAPVRNTAPHLTPLAPPVPPSMPPGSVLVGKGIGGSGIGMSPQVDEGMSLVHSPTVRAPARTGLLSPSPKKGGDGGAGGLKNLVLTGQSVGGPGNVGSGNYGSSLERQQASDAFQGHKGRPISEEGLRVLEGLQMMEPLHSRSSKHRPQQAQQPHQRPPSKSIPVALLAMDRL